MCSTTGARQPAAAAAGVGKSLCLCYAFADLLGKLLRGLSLGREAGFSPHTSPELEAQGPNSLGSPRAPVPQPEDRQPHCSCNRRFTASRRPELRSSRCRRRCERSRDAIQGCTPPCAHDATPSSVPPTARQAVALLLPFGTPGLLFWTHGRATSEGEAAFPERAEARSAAGPDRRLCAEGELTGTGKSCSEGRRRWVVGGGGGWGRRSPSYLQSRKYSAQLTEPGAEAAAAASYASVCASVPGDWASSVRLVASASARGPVRLGAGRGGRALDPPQGGGLDPGPWRPPALRRTHPPAKALASRRNRSSAFVSPPPRARGPCHPAPTADSLLPPPFLPAFHPPPLLSLCLLRSPAAVGSPCSQRLID